MVVAIGFEQILGINRFKYLSRRLNYYLQCDLAVVANVFSSMYEQSLSEFISSDCSGDYKRLLIAVTRNC